MPTDVCCERIHYTLTPRPEAARENGFHRRLIGMSKPNYRAIVTFDSERKVFIARAPELEHCSGEGASRAEALAKLEEEIDAQLANMLSHGSTPPRAVDEETFTGEISAKVSKLLHRDLVYQARSEGIDIDHFVGELLAAAMESRKQHRGTRSGNSRPR